MKRQGKGETEKMKEWNKEKEDRGWRKIQGREIEKCAENIREWKRGSEK